VTIIYSAHTKQWVKALLKKPVCFIFKKIFKEVEKEMQNTTNALEIQMDGVVMGAEITD